MIQQDGTIHEVSSIEQKILACASGLGADPAQKRRLRSLMSNGVDVDCLIKASIREGMAGFLYRNLLKAGIFESLKPQQKQTLESLYYQTVQFNLKLIYDMRKILEGLNEHEIHVDGCLPAMSSSMAQWRPMGTNKHALDVFLATGNHFGKPPMANSFYLWSEQCPLL